MPLIDAVADTLGEVKAKALLYCLGDTVAEADAEKLYKTLSNVRAKTLVEVLHDTLGKKIAAKTIGDTGQSKNKGVATNADLHTGLR